MVGLEHYLIVAAALFVIGIFGIFLNRKNVIVILMSIELILLAVNINFVAFSAYLNDVQGQIMAMFVLTVAAAEAAVGLAHHQQRLTGQREHHVVAHRRHLAGVADKVPGFGKQMLLL
jgi:NADH-quinone oxidoreductase subunit K